MEITNNDITKKNYKKLSIQVSLGGLSFCVLDVLTNQVLSLQSTTFNTNEVLDEQIWNAFTNYSILNDSFDEVIVLHQNTLNTFVPQPFFDENCLGSYLQYNIKVFETDLFAFDVLKNNNINNVYVPYININNFLIDQYKSFNYHHYSSILVEKLLAQSQINFEKQVFIHVQKEQFEIVIIQDKKLLYFNSFQPSTPEDFIYYILFTLEQSQLNPDTCTVHFLGVISESDDTFKIAYKYIRNCFFLDCKTIAEKAKISETQARQYYILLHS